MRYIPWFLIVPGLMVNSSCDRAKQGKTPLMQVQTTEEKVSSMPFIKMSRDSLYDKVLGTLVGSAVGDAMGAPTEMWARNNIRVEYGFVDSLDNMIREPSPEGTWKYNLPAGGTTDDTRWKVILGEYILGNISHFYSAGNADPVSFAQFIVDQYTTETEALKLTESFEPAPFEDKMRRMAWLQEWAVVAKPFAEQDLIGYHDALHKFYGGEMVCAGILYSPVIGILYPGAPELAYSSVYKLAIFDLGYARDVTALTSALVAAALPFDSSPDKMLSVLREIDPQQYFRSRLVGRSTYRIYRDAIYIVEAAKNVKRQDMPSVSLPAGMQDTLYYAQIMKAYELLDLKSQDFPFHAGEIHLINLTALIFSDFDFRKALAFITNYGRDNDTVGAVTGAILGAYYGYNKIPDDLKIPVVKVAVEHLGMDLMQLADQLTDQIIANGAVAER